MARTLVKTINIDDINNDISTNASNISANAANIFANSNLLGDFNTRSFGTNGYQKLSNGLILQWCRGSGTSTEGYQNVNWPIAFPNTILNAYVSTTGAVEDGMFQLAAFSNTGATVFNNTFNSGDGTITPYFFAIGY